MGDSISEGTVVAISKKVGQYVGANHVVASIETDYLTIAVRTTDAGTVTEWFAAEGDTVIVGADLYALNVDDSDEGDEGAPAVMGGSDDPPAPDDEEGPATPPPQPPPPPPPPPEPAPPAATAEAEADNGADEPGTGNDNGLFFNSFDGSDSGDGD